MKALLLFLTLSSICSYAGPIRPGMGVDLLKRKMAEAKYAGGDLELVFGGMDSPRHSTSWTVDQGTLLATFDGKTRKIASMSYSINCEPDVPIGKHFQFRVEWIDCESGQILISLKSGERGGAVQAGTAAGGTP